MSHSDEVQLKLALPSGRQEVFILRHNSTVSELKKMAQELFGLNFLRLVAPDGCVLDPNDSLQRLEDGSTINAVVMQPQLVANLRAFALCCCDQLITWGDQEFGGFCHRQFGESIEGVQSSAAAFAVILSDHRVCAWGNPECGGDTSEVHEQLKNVQCLQATFKAFAALVADGSVISWGDPKFGGDSDGVQDQLENVEEIASNAVAFAAILANRQVITWGFPPFGGDSSAVQAQLRNVKSIQSTAEAFAAILADETVICWGNPAYGGDCSIVQDQLKNVQSIQTTSGAFAALLLVVSVGYCFWSWPGWWCESSAGKFDTKSGTKLTTFSLCLVPAVLAFQHWSFCMALRVQSK